jgi:hypothetical protein
MERDRTGSATPDLFSTNLVQDASPPTRRVSAKEAPADTATQRHVLPKDLPKAIKYLTDRELDRLITASVQEAKRRGRLLPTSVWPTAKDASVQKQSPSRDKGQAEVVKSSLTRGQVSAVHAATKAGIKPSQIARQFGMTPLGRAWSRPSTDRAATPQVSLYLAASPSLSECNCCANSCRKLPPSLFL